MRLRTLTLGLALLLGLVLASPVLAQEVAQGKCLSNDKAAGIIKIEEYDIHFSKENPYGKPTGVETAFDVRHSKIGIPPEPGDILRIAYTVQDETMVAVKVMNVSKQDLRKK
jgi:hypothetical protein